ncbi:VOC family protein [Prauserella muralis]|uniref:Glyoxalase n=1 Tax=Prauserella muralis TaxID=588067 RepID=A0A2V4ALZ1_9PSEU|nr:VOC family protein [Prauserella muralis]PXY21033.1 glyoxalase [Prauserella muralis]TWE30107.1 putative glyoxalase superfamily protein PhnB [Prauserella muralis]
MGMRGVSKVVIGVRDQQRAREFWSQTLGFTVTTDAPYGDGGHRWLEVTSPDGRTALVLSADPDDEFRFPVREGRPTANVFFYADDVERTYEELSAKGVEFPAKPTRQPWGWWAMFADPDGNRYALQQREP